MDNRCECSMAISVLGDGCRYCQPQEYIDRLHEQIEENEKEIPDILFDGYRVWKEADSIVSSMDVSFVLDAVVRILRREED